MLCTESVKNNEFNEMCLDGFYVNILNSDANKKELWEFAKLILIVSHGNKSVEIRFSINKALIIGIISKESIV